MTKIEKQIFFLKILVIEAKLEGRGFDRWTLEEEIETLEFLNMD